MPHYTLGCTAMQLAASLFSIDVKSLLKRLYFSLGSSSSSYDKTRYNLQHIESYKIHNIIKTLFSKHYNNQELKIDIHEGQ